MAKPQALVLRVAIHAAPGAKRTEATGAHGDALKVRLAAPPVDGKANQALQAWLALSFGLRQNAVELLSGQTSRAKVWALHCEDASELQRCQQTLQSLMGA
jgi:uncharacterized protein (TIGR00251 family)